MAWCGGCGQWYPDNEKKAGWLCCEICDERRREMENVAFYEAAEDGIERTTREG